MLMIWNILTVAFVTAQLQNGCQVAINLNTIYPAIFQQGNSQYGEVYKLKVDPLFQGNTLTYSTTGGSGFSVQNRIQAQQSLISITSQTSQNNLFFIQFNIAQNNWGGSLMLMQNQSSTNQVLVSILTISLMGTSISSNGNSIQLNQKNLSPFSCSSAVFTLSSHAVADCQSGNQFYWEVIIQGSTVVNQVTNAYNFSSPEPQRKLLFYPYKGQNVLVRVSMGEEGGLEFFSFPGLSVIPNSVAFQNVSVGIIEAQIQSNGTIWVLTTSNSIIQYFFKSPGVFESSPLVLNGVLANQPIAGFAIFENSKNSPNPVLNAVFQVGQVLYDTAINGTDVFYFGQYGVPFVPVSLQINPDFIVAVSQNSQSAYFPRLPVIPQYFSNVLPLFLNPLANFMIAQQNNQIGVFFIFDSSQLIVNAQTLLINNALQGSITLSASALNGSSCSLDISYFATFVNMKNITTTSVQITTPNFDNLPTQALYPLNTSFPLKYIFNGNLLNIFATHSSNLEIQTAVVSPIQGGIIVPEQTNVTLSVNPYTNETLMFALYSNQTLNVWFCPLNISFCQFIGDQKDFPQISQFAVVYPVSQAQYYAIFVFVTLKDGVQTMVSNKIVITQMSTQLDSNSGSFSSAAGFSQFLVLGPVLYAFTSDNNIQVYQAESATIELIQTITTQDIQAAIPGFFLNSDLMVTGNFLQFGQTLIMAQSNLQTTVFVLSIVNQTLVGQQTISSSTDTANLESVSTAGPFLYLNYGEFIMEYDLTDLQSPQFIKIFSVPLTRIQMSTDQNLVYLFDQATLFIYTPGAPTLQSLVYASAMSSFLSATQQSFSTSILFLNGSFWQVNKEQTFILSGSVVQGTVAQQGSYTLQAYANSNPTSRLLQSAPCQCNQTQTDKPSLTTVSPPAAPNQFQQETLSDVQQSSEISVLIVDTNLNIQINSGNTKEKVSVKKRTFTAVFTPYLFATGSVIDFKFTCFECSSPISITQSQLSFQDEFFAQENTDALMTWYIGIDANVYGVANNAINTLKGTQMINQPLPNSDIIEECPFLTHDSTQMLVGCFIEPQNGNNMLLYVLDPSSPQEGTSTFVNIQNPQVIGYQSEIVMVLGQTTIINVPSVLYFDLQAPSQQNLVGSDSCPNGTAVTAMAPIVTESDNYQIYFACGNTLFLTTFEEVQTQQTVQVNFQNSNEIFFSDQIIITSLVVNQTSSLLVVTTALSFVASIIEPMMPQIQFIIPPYGTFPNSQNPIDHQFINKYLVMTHLNGPGSVQAVYNLTPTGQSTTPVVVPVSGGAQFPSSQIYTSFPSDDLFQLVTNTSNQQLQYLNYTSRFNLSFNFTPGFQDTPFTITARNNFLNQDLQVLLENDITTPETVPPLQWYAYILIILAIVIFGGVIFYGGYQGFKIRQQEKREEVLLQKHSQLPRN